jgi:hypothetical protein
MTAATTRRQHGRVNGDGGDEAAMAVIAATRLQQR